MTNTIKLTISICCLIAGALLFGCDSGDKQKQNLIDANKTKEAKKEQVQESVIEKALCFRNEYPFIDMPNMKDVEELKLSIENNKVTGIYNWLPAEKDRRVGNFTGVIKNNTIQANYTFMQEGSEDTATIKIILENDKALISGGKPELGLKASIKKIDCNNF